MGQVRIGNYGSVSISGVIERTFGFDWFRSAGSFVDTRAILVLSFFFRIFFATFGDALCCYCSLALHTVILHYQSIKN